MKKHSPRFHGQKRAAHEVLRSAFAFIDAGRLECLPRLHLKAIAAGAATRPEEEFHFRRCVACRIALATLKADLGSAATENMRKREAERADSMAMLEGGTAPEQTLNSLFARIRAASRLGAGKAALTLDLAWPEIKEVQKRIGCVQSLNLLAQRRYALQYRELVQEAQPALRIVLLYGLVGTPKAAGFATQVVRELRHDHFARRVLVFSILTEAPHLMSVVDGETAPELQKVRESIDRFEKTVLLPHTLSEAMTELTNTVEAMATEMVTSRDPETMFVSLLALRYYLGGVTAYLHEQSSDLVAMLPEVRRIVFQAASRERAAEFLAVAASAKTWKPDPWQTIVDSILGNSSRKTSNPEAPPKSMTA